jgi:predicted kinase
MVLEALLAMPAWRALERGDQQITFLAALLHDVAKPSCTREESDGRITSRGHSRRGAIAAREILWRESVDFSMREQITALVEHHQVPFFLVDRADAERLAVTVSQAARCPLLSIVSEADARGRRCDDMSKLLDNIALFEAQTRELACWDQPYAFSSEHARFVYFRDASRSLHAPAFDDTRCTVTVMSGLPGAGKDHWLATHGAEVPVVSLDAIRQELGVDPADAQGTVVQEARRRAREHLRSGTPFVWNATNISREMRSRVIGMLGDYKARVCIVYVETEPETLRARNRDREHVVPERVIDKLLAKWSVPSLTEAHEVITVVG